MAITGKELAALLGVSEAAVSMALNGRPGIGERRRAQILDAARANGYDFTRVEDREMHGETIAFVIYKRSGAIVTDSPFFAQLTEGVSRACKQGGFGMRVFYVYGEEETAVEAEGIKASGCRGMVLLATEMQPSDLVPFRKCGLPMVVLDAYFENVTENYVLINNVQGAFCAADYLMRRCKAQPGYLRSSYSIANFEERADGFFKAIRAHGMSTSKSSVIRLTPSIEGAYADMVEYIAQGGEVARCYFADNDMLAIGAMRALSENGYRIPQDVCIVGFDDLSYSQFTVPPLTTVAVPKSSLGRTAVERLLYMAAHLDVSPLKIELPTQIVKRGSVV